MLDFTLNTYIKLIDQFIENEYNFLLFKDFKKITPFNKSIILRQDVDLLPENSLKFARIQYNKNIQSTFFFRIIPGSYKPSIIREISDLGHEIGYHYEDLDLFRGNHEKAIKSFETNLKKFREIVPVSTICMHGSPRSPYDNKDLWKKYNYKDFDIIAEPYLDVDFNKIAYYTDTGRMWDGFKYSVRDKIIKNSLQETVFPVYHSSKKIIDSIAKNLFPLNAMITFHPQRWTNSLILWTKELVLQSTKNIIKKYIYIN